MSQLKTLRDRFASGGYRTAATADLVQILDAIMLDLGVRDPVAPTQTAGDTVEPEDGEAPPSSPSSAPTASDKDPWTSKD
jgi:hypothetical protein